MFRASSESVDDLYRRVQKGVSRLKGLEIEDVVSVEILVQLLECKMTVSEIVERIYGVTSSDEGFKSSYGKVWRQIRQLESKGLVSRKVFGRDKPYRLTDLAVTNLARIGGEEKQLSLIPKTDLSAYLATVALAVLVALQAVGWLQLGEITTIVLFPSFCFILGISFYGALRMIRRVF